MKYFFNRRGSGSGFIAKALGESIFAQAETIVELKSEIKDAVKCYFDPDKLPKIIRLHLVKEGILTL